MLELKSFYSRPGTRIYDCTSVGIVAVVNRSARRWCRILHSSLGDRNRRHTPQRRLGTHSGRTRRRQWRKVGQLVVVLAWSFAPLALVAPVKAREGFLRSAGAEDADIWNTLYQKAGLVHRPPAGRRGLRGPRASSPANEDALLTGSLAPGPAHWRAGPDHGVASQCCPLGCRQASKESPPARLGAPRSRRMAGSRRNRLGAVEAAGHVEQERELCHAWMHRALEEACR